VALAVEETWACIPGLSKVTATEQTVGDAAAEIINAKELTRSTETVSTGQFGRTGTVSIL